MSDFYLVYETTTGRVICRNDISPRLTLEQYQEHMAIESPDFSVIQVDETDSEDVHIVDGLPVHNTPIAATWDVPTIVADGEAEAVLSPLPIPCTVIVDRQDEVLVGDGTYEFFSSMPGMYEFHINHPHHDDFTITLEATLEA